VYWFKNETLQPDQNSEIGRNIMDYKISHSFQN